MRWEPPSRPTAQRVGPRKVDGQQVTPRKDTTDGGAPPESRAPSHHSNQVLAVADGDGADAFPLKVQVGSDADDELPEGFLFDWGAYRKVWGKRSYQDAVTALFAECTVLYGRIARWMTVNAPRH